MLAMWKSFHAVLLGILLGSVIHVGRAHWSPEAAARKVCSWGLNLPTRPYTLHLSDFGAVNDGVTLNTHAFTTAIAAASLYSKKGGALLYVPPGTWLTGSFNLTSHITLFLDREAVILGSEDPRDWPIIDPLLSYGRGRELPGRRYASLINGRNLRDVVITGNNGTIDGQGAVWWNMFENKTLHYTRGHLLELIDSKEIVISNLTFHNSPFWNIHPVYCRNVALRDLTILASHDSPNTDGIDPDSSSHVCIENCYISNGDDIIAIKSGWDEYGIQYGRPSSNIVIRNVIGDTHSSAGISIGSEMSGGVKQVYVNGMVIHNAIRGIHVKTSSGRGGYVKQIFISNMTLVRTRTGIGFSGNYGEHPDDKYDPNALPVVKKILIQNITGETLKFAGLVRGIPGDPFTKIQLLDIHIKVLNTSEPSWNCSDVQGYSKNVFPSPCIQLKQEHQKWWWGHNSSL